MLKIYDLKINLGSWFGGFFYGFFIVISYEKLSDNKLSAQRIEMKMYHHDDTRDKTRQCFFFELCVRNNKLVLDSYGNSFKFVMVFL